MDQTKSDHLTNTLHKHARTMPRATVKRLVKHWDITWFVRDGKRRSYTIALDGTYVGKVIKEADLWRATKLRSNKDLFSEYGIVIKHKQLFDLIPLCAQAEREVSASIRVHIL